MKSDPVRAIADACLYEGYILWPYRRSALKNQQRFTFGGVYPTEHSKDHPDDPSCMQTEVLLRGGEETRVEVTVRFLQVVTRRAAERRGEQLETVDELTVDGQRYLSWEEAVEREIEVPPLSVAQLRGGYRAPIAIAADTRREDLHDHRGACVGGLIRGWSELRGELFVRAQPVADDVERVSVTIRNHTPFAGGPRAEALKRTFCSTHTMLRAQGGEFASLADPPPELRAAAAACQNLGTWPVPVGEPPDRSTILSSPIILDDYPRVAPESPGDLFDGGEIDQLLILNILAMTDEEKAEMRASDPRAAEIIDRSEALSEEELMRLHGAIREMGMAR
jgi:hypothetical protein